MRVASPSFDCARRLVARTGGPSPAADSGRRRRRVAISDLSTSSVTRSSTSTCCDARRRPRPLPPLPASSRRANTASRRNSARSGSVKEVVAPVDQRAQRLLARQRGAVAAAPGAGSGRQAAPRSSRPTARARAPRRARAPAECRRGAGRCRRPPRRFRVGHRESRLRPRVARSTNRRTRLERVAARRGDQFAAGREPPAAAPDTLLSPRDVAAARGWTARILRCGPAAQEPSTQARRTPATRCSQLSSTSSSRRSAHELRQRLGDRSAGIFLDAEHRRRPLAARSCGSVSGASSTNHTPSG